MDRVRALADDGLLSLPVDSLDEEARLEREAIQQEASGPTRGTPALPEGWPAPLRPEAFIGVAGEFGRAVEPHTEADQAAVHVQLLTALGNMMGRGPHFRVEQDRHGTNEYCVVVGRSGGGRKTSAYSHVRAVNKEVDPAWTRNCVAGGLSSGEGLIHHVRDAVESEETSRTGEREVVVKDPGIADKRLLAYVPEFGVVLRVMARPDNTLSPILRLAWDFGDLRTLTKHSPARATDAHVSLIGHITEAELLKHFDKTEQASGLGNRILWTCASRSKLLPDGGAPPVAEIQAIVTRLRRVMEYAQRVGEVTRTHEAQKLWREVYPDLTREAPGLINDMRTRGAAHVVRLSVIYAVLDETSMISIDHLRAALAVWAYAEDSARYIFGESLADPIAEIVLKALRKTEGGLNRTEISGLFSGNKPKHQIDDALEWLQHGGLAEKVSLSSARGRPQERWMAVR